MSLKRQQCMISSNAFNGSEYQCRGPVPVPDVPSMEDIAQKIKNSICLILEICDTQNLHKTTKFLAYSIFIRYLTKHACSSDDEFATLILCALRLAAKFNEATPKCALFDQQSYSNLLLPHKPMTHILQFQLSLFCELGFKIYLRTPYQLLDELVRDRNLPISFFNSVTAFLDFAITLVEMVQFTPDEMFAGCLVALKKSRVIENKKILGLIQEICGNVYKSNQAGHIILQTWELIVNESAPVPNNSQ